MDPMRDPSPAQKAIIDKFLDPDGVIEVGADLLAVMTPREVAEVDQLLAARFSLHAVLRDAAKAPPGVVRGLARQATMRAVGLVVRLDGLLSTAQARSKRLQGGRDGTR